MPAVETFPAAPPANRRNDLRATPNNHPNQPATGDDFDSVMRAALAPAAPKSTVKNQPRPGKYPPAPGKCSSSAAPAARASATTDENHSPDKISADKSDSATGGGKKNSAGAEAKTSLDLNSPLLAAAAEPAPLIVSLPGFLSARSATGLSGDLSLPAMSVAMENVRAASGQTVTTDKIESAVSALLGKVEKAEAGPGESELEKNLLLKNLSPVRPAEAAARSAELTPGSGKNLSAAGLTVTPDLAQAAESNPSDASLADVQAARAAENTGTGVATTDSSMKNQQKTNKVAGPDVKVLPVGETGTAREKNLPTVMLAAPVRAADSRGTDLNFSFANGNSNSNAPVTDNAPVLNALDLPSLADARLRALERAHDMMALHSMRLVESKSDSLSVVIKPSVGTELSLELRQRNGGVEAQATLTRGDHQLLSQHWPELQQRLELRGIKLAPLADEAFFSTGGNGHFQQDQASREEAAQRASAFAEFASLGSAGGATARFAPVHDGWESWA